MLNVSLDHVLRRLENVAVLPRLLLFALPAWFSVFNAADAASYYLDPVNGHDSYNGLFGVKGAGLDGPWKTAEKINSRLFSPGDSILIRRGTVVNGRLWPKGSGAPGSPITMDAYDSGPAPVIDASSIPPPSSGIHLSNQSYWTIQNLEITNDKQPHSQTNEGIRKGIWIEFFANCPATPPRGHLIIRNNAIKNIFGSTCIDATGSRPTRYATGGIWIGIAGPYVYKLDDVLIEGNNLYDIWGEGIIYWGPNGWNGIDGWLNYLTTNFVVRGNTVRRTAGDGIVIHGTSYELIEYNTVDSAGMYGDPGSARALAAVWPTSHEGGLIQYNVVSHTKQFRTDGQAFNNDAFLKGTTIFQYNYSHDNEGGFFLDCIQPNGDQPNARTILRYNISQNDKKGDVKYGGAGPSYLFMNRGNALIHNNIFYADTIAVNTNISKPPDTFYNNIFISSASSWNQVNANGIAEYNVFSNNCYYGGLATPKNKNGGEADGSRITGDPLFQGSPPATDVGLSSLQCYKVKPNSPCINAGRKILNNGGRDFRGAGLYNGKPDVGAYEAQNIIPMLHLLLND